ncbi:hypothetical protein BRAS3843_560030 [Bradyrhizobium sp. STM 3843]|nr:hypothetical protein BRAS3843_560030 [Bradyrhizobium sp. STM 3843]
MPNMSRNRIESKTVLPTHLSLEIMFVHIDMYEHNGRVNAPT